VRGSLRIALTMVVITASVLCSAPAAMAKLRLRVLGVAPGHRFAPAQVYSGFGCTGANRSPALRIAGVPAQAKSLAVTIFDPDAATQSGWWHWLVYDLPPSTRLLAENAAATLPAAQQGPNDFGDHGYDGPCPPPGGGVHHYRVTVWALKVRHLSKLGAAPGASAAFLDFLIESNALAHRRVVVRYSR
jgi:Raf kinase inhibitor-like YbhB/YbcL family protein